MRGGKKRKFFVTSAKHAAKILGGKCLFYCLFDVFLMFYCIFCGSVEPYHTDESCGTDENHVFVCEIVNGLF